jgi:hypothetical protein
LQFLGALLDNCREVRHAERKILKIVKLNDLAMFKSSIDRLMENLDRYLQVCFVLCYEIVTLFFVLTKETLTLLGTFLLVIGKNSENRAEMN